MVLRLRGSAGALAIARSSMLPSPSDNKVGNPDEVISELNSPACQYPCQRFAARLTTGRRMTRGHDWSLAFIMQRTYTPYPLPTLAGAFGQTPF